MGMIINIDEALKNRSQYNILAEPLHEMMRTEQEAWEASNPIDHLYVRKSIDKFQERYSSSIGFENAFAETSDYAVGPIFNQAEGFSAVFRTRTFQGGFIITQQVLEDRQVGKIKDDAMAFTKRWHGNLVEYAMKYMDAGFGIPVMWGDAVNGQTSRLYLESADTTDGDIYTATKNPLFCRTHKTVKRDAASTPLSQSNIFLGYTSAPTGTEGSFSSVGTNGITLTGDSTAKITQLADLINQVITEMQNYKDDNGKYVNMMGSFEIVAANDPHLKAAIETALSMEQFKVGESMYLNPAYKIASTYYTPYLRDIDATKGGGGFFIVNKAYNEANHGPEFTERIPYTLDAIWKDDPKGVKYAGRQRFDINVASWRGIAYVRIKPVTATTDASATVDAKLNNINNYKALALSAKIVKPVTVEGTVATTVVS